MHVTRGVEIGSSSLTSNVVTLFSYDFIWWSIWPNLYASLRFFCPGSRKSHVTSYLCKWAQMVIPPSKTQVLSMLSNEWYTVIFVSYFLSFYINQYSYSTFLIPKYFYTCLHCKKQTRGGNSSSDFDSRSRCQIINVFVVIFRVIVLLRTCKYCVSPFSLLRSFLCILFISVSIVTVNILYFITFRRANCWFASCHFVSMRAPVVRIRVADWSSARRKRKT